MVGRNRGSVMLARLGIKQEEIAQKCGVVRSTVGHWETSYAVPLLRAALILRDVYDIPLEAWFQPFVETPPVCLPNVRYMV